MSFLNPTADIITAHGADGSIYYEPSRLAGLEKMRFTTNRRVEGAYSGRHIAKRRGGAGSSSTTASTLLATTCASWTGKR